MADRIQLRRDVAADWTSVDPVLAEGELGLELDTDKMKMGDGTSVWSALPYAAGGSGGSALEVLDEGVSIGAAVESLDFVGAGVTATNVGNDVTVTIAGGGGSGDVVGPAGATDNAIARYDTATGKLIQDSSATIDDSGNLSVTGTVDGRDVAADGTTLDAHVALVNQHIDWTVDQGATNIDPGNYTDTNTTYVSSDFVHDDLTGFVANEHIDWTVDQGATNIHSGNYTDTDTVVEVLDEGVSKTSAVTSLDFAGAGVVATNTGDDVTVTISGDLIDDLTPELGGPLDCLDELVNNINALRTGVTTGTITTPPIVGGSPGRLVSETNQTHDYSNGVLFGGVALPASVLAIDTFTLKQSSSPFGVGNLFQCAIKVQNEPTVAANLGSFYVVSANPTYTADSQTIGITTGPRTINVAPTLKVANSGTLNANQCSNFWSSYSIFDGVNTTAVIHTHVSAIGGTAGASSQGPEVGFQMYEVAEKAMFDDTAVINVGATAQSLTGKWLIHQGANYEYPNRWNGGQYYKLNAKSTAYTLDETDHIVTHTGSTARTFTLPNITAANKGQEYVIIRDATATTTVDPDASDTINGGSAGVAITITTRYDSVRLISDGVSKWYSI